VIAPPRARLIVDSLNPNVVDTIFDILRIDFGEQRVGRDRDGSIYYFVEHIDRTKASESAILAVLARCDLADPIVTPMPVERWDEERRAWVGDRPKRKVRRPLTDVTWVVTVEPADVFHWAALRKELERRGRPIVGEGERRLDVPAIDEADARQLGEDLSELEEVRRTSIRRLGWFERWRRREQVFGNYGSN